MSPPKECVFCQIAAGVPTGKGDLKPSRVLFQNDYFFILEDIEPATDHHYLAIPIKHIKDASYLQPGDEELGKFIYLRIVHKCIVKNCKISS